MVVLFLGMMIWMFKDIEKKLSSIAENRLATLAVMLLCDYWIVWSLATEYEFFGKELKELKNYLLRTL